MKKIKHRMRLSFCITLVFLISRPVFLAGQEENLNIFEVFERNRTWIEWSDGKNMLIHHLNRQAFDHLDRRDNEIAGLKTMEDWKQRQQKVKTILNELIGPFPEKTPLKPMITGIVKKTGFRIEKLIYESMPGFYVTACLFIPEKIKGKRPAIIQVSGHSNAAFRSQGTMNQIYNFVMRGFIVLAIDPVNQGERVQYWDEKNNSPLLGGSPVPGHSYFGNQMFITGVSPIRYFIWDGIRGVDYLLTRKEVDPEKIGIYGCSGGGTQTAFIAAFDPRIKAAVPGCYITGYRRLLESIGPQDAEQNIYHGIKHGITHADLLEVRAPLPLLISSTTRDYFSIQGAIETFEEVKTAYRAFGKEENIGQAIDDAGHGFADNIIAIYAFFQKVFDLPGITDVLTYEGYDPADLQVTQTGQLETSLKGETAFTLNKAEAQKLSEKLNISRNNPETHLDNVLKKSAELSGYTPQPADSKSVFRGRYRRDDYSVELYAFHGEGNYIIPLLLFVPEKKGPLPAIIYLHPKGKNADALPGGKIEQLVKKGYLVAAPDVIGTGETADDFFGPMYESILIGRSIVGLQAGDIDRIVNFLIRRQDTEKSGITGMAFDEMCPTLLHASAWNKSITSLALIGSPLSYRNIVMNRFYEVRRHDETTLKKKLYPDYVSYLNYIVAGALTAYDLPDLTACIAPRKIALIEPMDHMKKPASEALINEELSFPEKVFKIKSVPGNLKVSTSAEELVSVADWCRE